MIFSTFSRYETFLYSELQFRAMYSSVHKSFLPKTVRISDFTPAKIVQVHSKSYKSTLKSISKSPDGYEQYYSLFSGRNTHAYKCYLRNYKYLTKFLESDSQAIRSKILYREIQNFSLNQNLHLAQEKSPKEKNRLLGIQPSYRNCIAEMTVIWKHYQNDRYYRTKKCYFGLKNIQNQFQGRHFSSKTAQFLFEPATFVGRPLFLLRGSSFSENQ